MGRAAAGKKAKDPNKPKRPTSAYFYFVASKRREAEQKGQRITKVAEWTKEVSAVWRALTDKQKEGFNKEAATDKARYDREMQAYTGRKPKDVNQPKRPQSAYFLFLADFRAKCKHMFTQSGGNKDLIRAAGEKWNSLSASEKSGYEKLHEKEKEKYEVLMRNYNAGLAAGPPAQEEEEEEDDDEEDDE